MCPNFGCPPPVFRRALCVILIRPNKHAIQSLYIQNLFLRKYLFPDSVRTKLRAALAENVTLVQKVSNLGKEVSNTKSENVTLVQKVSILGKEVSNTKLDNMKLSEKNSVVLASLDKVQEENR